MALAELLKVSANLLKQSGVEDYETDARLLLEYVTGYTRTQLYLHGSEHPSKEQNEQFEKLLQRRLKREPVAYILGEQEFWSLPFRVTPDVLIPRPETEFLLETTLQRCSKANLDRGRILDLCCGSGIISVVLARETGKRITAVDLSAEALAVSLHNSRKNDCSSCIDFVCGDLLTGFREAPLFSLIVSNPPYVARRDVEMNLQPEVAEYEPHMALDGGDEGMDIIVEIHRQLQERLMPGGELFMEFGAEQGQMVHDLFCCESGESSLYNHVEIIKDYAGRDRVLHAVRSDLTEE